MRATADSVREQVGQVSDGARNRWAASTEIRKASRSRVPDSPVPRECWDSVNGRADGEYPAASHSRTTVLPSNLCPVRGPGSRELRGDHV